MNMYTIGNKIVAAFQQAHTHPRETKDEWKPKKPDKPKLVYYINQCESITPYN